MSGDTKRALRRHHRKRLKRKRAGYWYGADENSGPLTRRHLGIALATPAPCSCWMCGNPRRYFGEKTVQEKRADDALSHEVRVALKGVRAVFHRPHPRKETNKAAVPRSVRHLQQGYPAWKSARRFLQEAGVGQ